MTGKERSAQRWAFRNAAARVAKALVGSKDPGPYEPGPDKAAMRINRGGDQRTRRNYICPAKIWKNHPDASVRNIAWNQAHAQHQMWGPCRPRPMTLDKAGWEETAKRSGGKYFVKSWRGLDLVVEG